MFSLKIRVIRAAPDTNSFQTRGRKGYNVNRHFKNSKFRNIISNTFTEFQTDSKRVHVIYKHSKVRFCFPEHLIITAMSRYVFFSYVYFNMILEYCGAMWSHCWLRRAQSSVRERFGTQKIFCRILF